MIYSPAPAGVWPARPPENPAGLRLPEMQEGRPLRLAFRIFCPFMVGGFFRLCRSCGFNFRGRAHLRLPAAWRHPVVRPDSDRQLLAHPPVSAEPAGAVSGCRYGPMSEKPGLQRPFRSRRPCRAGNGAPCTPDGV